MKAVLIIIISMSIFICFSIWTQHSIEEHADIISKKIEKIEDAVNKSDWKKAEHEMFLLQKTWSPKRRFLMIMIDHMEVDMIDQSFTKINKLIELKSREDCITELAVLKQFILHIPEKEKLNLTNIF